MSGNILGHVVIFVLLGLIVALERRTRAWDRLCAVLVETERAIADRSAAEAKRHAEDLAKIEAMNAEIRGFMVGRQHSPTPTPQETGE